MPVPRLQEGENPSGDLVGEQGSWPARTVLSGLCPPNARIASQSLQLHHRIVHPAHTHRKRERKKERVMLTSLDIKHHKMWEINFC